MYNIIVKIASSFPSDPYRPRPSLCRNRVWKFNAVVLYTYIILTSILNIILSASCRNARDNNFPLFQYIKLYYPSRLVYNVRYNSQCLWKYNRYSLGVFFIVSYERSKNFKSDIAVQHSYMPAPIIFHEPSLKLLVNVITNRNIHPMYI